MAVVAVGDIDQKQVEALIRSHFGSLEPRGQALPPPNNAVPLHKELLVNVASDPEVTRSQVEIIRKRPADRQRTAGDYRRMLVESLFQRMFNERFSDLTLKPDAKFLNAGVGGGGLSLAVDTFSLRAAVADGRIAEALEALEVEARRVREFGFTTAELDRAKRSNARSRSAIRAKAVATHGSTFRTSSPTSRRPASSTSTDSH
jgi:zinc protease